MTGVLNETATPYREWAPHPALADRIVCTWHDPARPRPQPVMPDACIDLVWDGRTLQVAGPDTRSVTVDCGLTYVGIRFRPGAAPGFLRVPSDALLDTRVNLADIWGQRASDALISRLLDAPSRAREILEQALLERLDRAREPDGLVTAAVSELAQPFFSETEALAPEDTSRVSQLAVNLSVSERTLRRRCTVGLGYGPKTVERILRFRRALRLLDQRYGLAEAARLAGYADQAHLTNESQRLAGLTPGALAAAPAPLSIAGNGIN